jgi:hypothetical protein
MISKNSKSNNKMNVDTKVKMLRNPDKTLWRQVKAQAALDGVTQTQLVEEAIKIRLNQKSK